MKLPTEIVCTDDTTITTNNFPGSLNIFMDALNKKPQNPRVKKNLNGNPAAESKSSANTTDRSAETIISDF